MLNANLQEEQKVQRSKRYQRKKLPLQNMQGDLNEINNKMSAVTENRSY